MQKLIDFIKARISEYADNHDNYSMGKMKAYQEILEEIEKYNEIDIVHDFFNRKIINREKME